MAKKLTPKQREKLLKKYIARQCAVKITMPTVDGAENLHGFILDMSSDFLLLQLIGDFEFDGYAIIKKDAYESIRHNKYDKTTAMILKEEGLFDRDFGINQVINLESWVSLLEDLKRFDWHVILESERKNSSYFHIGPIIGVSRKKVEIHSYDPTGKMDKESSKIKLDQLTVVKFGDRYSTIFRKYLKII